MQNIRLLRNKVYLAIIAMVSVIVLTTFFAKALPNFSVTNIINLAANSIDVTNSLNYQKSTPIGQKNVAIGGGGYVTGIYLHPQQKDLIYIKTDVGGFYRWNLTEQRWIPLTDHFPLEQSNYYGGEALALDPNNPNLVYIAAGKFTADWWPHRGTILKSTDQGNTWNKLNIDLKMGGNEDLRWAGERLAINPANSNILFFGSRQDGLWKSSDAGTTWKNVTTFPGKLQANIGITAITFTPKSTTPEIYAVAYGDGIYKSTDSETWSKIADSPSETKRIVITGENVLYVTHSLGVSKYQNGVWQNITPVDSKDAFNALTINSANPKDLLVATSGENTKIYHSLDAGTTWTEQKRSMNSTVPWWSDYMLSTPSVAAIEFDPHVAGRVWLTDWYGIWRTENINQNPVGWTNYQKGHEEVVTFTLVSPPKGALLLSGVADVDGFYHNNGLDIYPSKPFRGTSFQDTYSIAYCETDPLKLVRVGGKRSTDSYTGATSTDGGLTWQQFASFPPKTIPMRVAVSATNPNLFIVTTSNAQPLRTTDGGASWKSVSGLPDGVQGVWNWTQSLANDAVDGKTFYYYATGKVYRSTNGGASFVAVNKSLATEDGWHSLKAMPGVKGEVWLSLDQQGLYRSTDGGKTFSKLNQVVNAHLFAFGKPNTGSIIPALYLYGNVAELGNGIFRSLDQGKTWARIGDSSHPIGNSPNVLEASKQQFGLVFIGTNGRGIYYGTQ
jgi:xyloglucan-specific exo-beta-1,4-glucanase